MTTISLLTLNIPLSRWLPDAWATYSLNSSKNSNTSHQVGINGTALADNNLSYNLQQSYTDNNIGYGGYLSGRYRASVGEFSSGYSYQGDNRQWNYSAQGSIVAHPNGITLGRSLQDALLWCILTMARMSKFRVGKGFIPTAGAMQ